MRFLSFILLFLSAHCFAVDYFWSPSVGSGSFPSPVEACRAISNLNLGGGILHGYAEITKISDIKFQCKFKDTNGAYISFPNPGQYFAGRNGDSCAVGSTFNQLTGTCDFPSPDAGKTCEGKDSNNIPNIINTSGECVPYLRADQGSQCKNLANQGTKLVTFYISFDQDGNPQQPPSPEKFGCKVSILSVANCKMPAAKTTGGVTLAPAQVARCRVGASFTGEVAGSGSMSAASPSGGTDGICGDGQDCMPPDQPKVQEQKPCNYVLDGEGRKVCSSSQFTGDPGSMDCGSVNGSFTCITKPSKSTGQITDTKIDTKANADGSTTTTKTDTITQVTCGGAGSCVSTTTKVSQVTTKDGNGNTTGSSTSCTGAKCATSSNPDADGDGLGDCVKDCDKGSPSVNGLTKPKQGSFDDIGSDWDQKVDKAKKDLKDGLEKLKTALDPVANVQLASGGGRLICPEPAEVLGRSIDICIDKYQDQLSWLSLIFFACCALLAILIIYVW